MPDTVAEAAAALGRALSAPGWLALGVLLHVANQVARGRGWYAIVRTATGDDPRLRRRDAVGAWIAGAGAGGVTFARGGDALRVLLVAQRLRGTGGSLLTGTLVAEGAGELAVGALIILGAIALGTTPQIPAAAPFVVVALGAAAAAGWAAWRLAARHRARRAGHGLPARPHRVAAWLRGVAARVGAGCSAMRPAAYARGVLPWQLLSRGCRLAALACFLCAFGLPVSAGSVLLVVCAQCGGRIVPFAPASVGAGVAMLAAAFGPVTGTAVPTADVAAFFLGTSAVLTLVGTALAVALSAQALPSAGLRAGLGALGRRSRTRVAAVPRT